MSAELDQRIEQLFDQAVGLPPEQREQFLRQQCSDDAMIARVEKLLHHHELAGEAFLAGMVSGQHTVPPRPTPSLEHVGPYTILSVLGEGGMGTVYEARQDHPRRLVALKLIRPGLMTPHMLRRFEYEADVLGRLEHPGIARIYHAGVVQTPLGKQPFFAMELVKGLPLDQWVKKNEPTLKKRLELLIAICQAVHHAHTKGVIHRDLKPSNILVTDDGQPKVLDFGVARATDVDVQTTTLHTAPGEVIGTLPYMAPEQAAGRAHDLDTSSDVYALGVIAYELLSGKMPYELKGKAIHEQVSLICEAEPTRLSSIDRSFRGDVETIVGKALEKDKTRRYHTAGELAADIRRYLDYEPITARRPSTWYQVRKFAGRNKLLVGSVASILLVLTAGVITSTVFAIRAERQKRAALTQTAMANQIADLMQQMLRSANPEDDKGADYTVRQLLDEFSANLGNQLEGQPQVEAEVRSTIGRAYRGLGIPQKAQPHLERALELLRRLHGPRHETVARALLDLAWNLTEQRDLNTGEARIREALDIYRSRGVQGQPHLYAMYHLQRVLISQKRFPESQAVGEEALALARQAGETESPEISRILGQLASAKRLSGDFAAAERLAQQTLEMQRRLGLRQHPEAAWALNNLGGALLGQDKLGEAETAYGESLLLFRKHLPPGHRAIVQTASKLASVLQAEGKFSQAEPLYLEVLAQRKTEPETAAIALFMTEFAIRLQSAGKPVDAEKWFREGLAIRRKVLGEESTEVVWSLNRLIAFFREQGKTAELAQLWRDTVDIRRTRLGPLHPLALSAMVRLAAVLKDDGKVSEADAVLAEFQARSNEALSRLRVKATTQGVSGWYLQNLDRLSGEAWQLLVDGRPQEALRLRSLVVAAEGMLPPADSRLSTQRADHAQMLNHFGMQLYSRGKLDEAESLFREALDIRRKALPAGHAEIALTLNNLGSLLRDQGKLAAAEPFLQEGLSIRRKSPSTRSASLDRSLNDLALLRQAQGRLSDAEALHREALAARRKFLAEESPDVAASLRSLSSVLRSQGKNAEIEAMWRQSVEIRRTSLATAKGPEQRVVIYLSLIQPLLRIGSTDEARSCCRKALELNPTNTAALNQIAWELATSADTAQREPALAVELAAKAVQLAPKDGSIHNTLGVARYRAGDFKGAVAELTKSMQLRNGGDAYDYVFLAMAHHRLGETAAARQWNDKAVSWTQRNQSQTPELRTFLAEAAELLGVDAKRDRAPATRPASQPAMRSAPAG